MKTPQGQQRKALPRSLLQLNRFWIESLRLTSEPFEGPPALEDVRLLGESEFAPADGGFLVRLNVRSRTSRERPLPFRFQMRISGYFTLPEEVPEDERRRLVSVSGSAMLYSAARVVLVMIIGAGYSPLQLPSINFIDFFEGLEERQEPQPK